MESSTDKDDEHCTSLLRQRRPSQQQQRRSREDPKWTKADPGSDEDDDKDEEKKKRAIESTQQLAQQMVTRMYMVLFGSMGVMVLMFYLWHSMHSPYPLLATKSLWTWLWGAPKWEGPIKKLKIATLYPPEVTKQSVQKYAANSGADGSSGGRASKFVLVGHGDRQRPIRETIRRANLFPRSFPTARDHGLEFDIQYFDGPSPLVNDLFTHRPSLMKQCANAGRKPDEEEIRYNSAAKLFWSQQKQSSWWSTEMEREMFVWCAFLGNVMDGVVDLHVTWETSKGQQNRGRLANVLHRETNILVQDPEGENLSPSILFLFSSLQRQELARLMLQTLFSSRQVAVAHKRLLSWIQDQQAKTPRDTHDDMDDNGGSKGKRQEWIVYHTDCHFLPKEKDPNDEAPEAPQVYGETVIATHCADASNLHSCCNVIVPKAQE